MSTLATDTFDRANGGLGSNWTTMTGATAPAIVSNEVEIDGDPEHAYYNAVTPPADQWAQVTVKSPVVTTADNGVGPMLRAATGADSHYMIFAWDAGCQIYVANSGYTAIGSVGASFASGDVLYLEIQGTSLISKKNGSASGMPSGTDGTHASGRFGFFGANQAENPHLDDWSGGDFVSSLLRPDYSHFPKPKLRRPS